MALLEGDVISKKSENVKCIFPLITLSSLGVLINDKAWGGVGGGGPGHLKKKSEIFYLLSQNCLPIYFIVLKSSKGIFRKSQKVSAFKYDPKGV